MQRRKPGWSDEQDKRALWWDWQFEGFFFTFIGNLGIFLCKYIESKMKTGVRFLVCVHILGP